MFWFFSIAVSIALLPFAAGANTPEDLVRWIYQSDTTNVSYLSRGLTFLTLPDNRASYLTTRFAGFYDANETYGDDLLMACMDYYPSVPGTDSDSNEVYRTLNLVSSQSDTEWRVDARFTNMGSPHHIAYVFVPEGGTWKLDDIVRDGNSMMAQPCSPKIESGPKIRGSGYCYIHGTNWLTLDIGGLGNGLVDVQSVQAGHFCGMDAQISATPGGWIARGPDGVSACELKILAAPEGGLRLSATYGCSFFCGQRASLDQIYFPATSQVHCSQMAN